MEIELMLVDTTKTGTQKFETMEKKSMNKKHEGTKATVFTGRYVGYQDSTIHLKYQ